MEQVARVNGAELSCAGRVVARYRWGHELPRELSPRPYLHPVTTLAGTPVTGFMPADHRHHLGASLAIPIVNGANFWGGRTYVRGEGSIPLDNHGTQRHTRWSCWLPDRLAHELSWEGPDGAPVAREERSISARPVDDGSWVLSFESALFGAGGPR